MTQPADPANAASISTAAAGNTAADETDIGAAMAELAATFATHTELVPTLAAVTKHAVQLMQEVDFADVLLIDEHGYRSLAATAPIATDLDDEQINFGEGPCLQAVGDDPLVHAPDLTDEPRWPRFAAAAVAAGVESMMSFHLYTHPDRTRGGIRGRGALNLFSLNRAPFSPQDQAVGAMLATHAATALIAANRQLQFESALASRDLIGQAKGILMQRFTVDAIRAFQLIKKLSQDTNTPIRTIAQRIVDNP